VNVRPLVLFLLISFFSKEAAQAQYVIIDSVIFKGNEKTKGSILRRELDLNSGDTVQVADLDARLEFNRRKLTNTNLFILVKGDYTQNKPEHVVITYEFSEQWYLLGYPIFQLADRNLNEWWSKGHSFDRTIYGAHLIHNNFMGRNEKLSFKAETGFSQRVELGYSNPYLDRKKTIGLGLALSYSNSTNIIYKTDFDKLKILSGDKILRERWASALSLRKRFKFYDFQFLEFRYSHTVITDTVLKLNPNYFYKGLNEQNFLQLTYAFSYDFRDNAAYPLSGKKLDFGYNYSQIMGQNGINFWDVRAAAAYFLDLKSGFFFSTEWKAKYTQENRSIPFANLQALGYGGDNVRGYELNVINGTHYLLSKNTFKFQLINKIIPLRFIPYKQFNKVPIAVYPTVFFDFAYVNQPQPELTNSRFSNRWIYGTGLGFDFVTYYNFVLKMGVPVANGGKSGLFVSIGREF